MFKKILLLQTLILSSLSICQAQQLDDEAFNRTTKLKKVLGLNDAQANSVYGALVNVKSGCGKLKTYTEISNCRTTQGSSMKDQFNKILTPEQKAKFDSMKKSRKTRK